MIPPDSLVAGRMSVPSKLRESPASAGLLFAAGTCEAVFLF
jgi:hypothetical protein